MQGLQIIAFSRNNNDVFATFAESSEFFFFSHGVNSSGKHKRGQSQTFAQSLVIIGNRSLLSNEYYRKFDKCNLSL